MTFEGQYLTYNEYKDIADSTGITAMAEASFNLLEFEARRKIDIRTQNRLKDADEIPQEVKLCEYALVNGIYAFASATSGIADGGNIKSENTDGYSISYINASEISEVIKSKNSEIDDIIRSYLLEVIYDGEHLMYLGVD